MSERTARVDELLREEIGRIMAREIADPRIGFVTITKVEVTSDLRHAVVWASVIGRPDERAATIRVLGRAMPFIRHRLGVLRLRRIPELHVKLDDTAERGTRLLTIMQELEAGHEPEFGPETETLPTPQRRPAGDGEAVDEVPPNEPETRP